MRTVLPELKIDFGEVGYWNKREPFSVCLSPKPLEQLLSDAKNLIRIYELALITRPGDIWDYLEVKDLIATVIVQQRIARLRGASESISNTTPREELAGISFLQFDQLFSWAGDDTEPVDEAWLDQNSKKLMSGYAEDLLRAVQGEISSLAGSDPLAKYLFKLIKVGKHPFDLLSRSKAKREGRHVSVPQLPQSQGFYDKLSEIIRDPSVASIAYRGDGDLNILRLLATEQRRRAELTGHKPGNALQINALVENQALNSAWNSEIWYFSEGIGHGDIFIQSPGIDQKPIKKLIEMGHRVPPGGHILSWQDEGEISGYLKIAGDGWVHYRPTKPSSRRHCLSLRRPRDHAANPILKFDNSENVIYGHEKVLIIVGPAVPVETSDAVKKLVDNLNTAQFCPILLNTNPALPAGTNGEAICSIPIKNIGIEALVQKITKSTTWIDVVILIEPDSTIKKVANLIRQSQNDPWTPWLVSISEHETLDFDLNLKGSADTIMKSAFQVI